MTNAEKFAEVFGTDLKKQYATKSWWNQEFVPSKKENGKSCKHNTESLDGESLKQWSITVDYMTDRQCGNCKYIGAETGDDIDLYGEMQSLHFCENEKSIFKACIKTATGCREFKLQEESKE